MEILKCRVTGTSPLLQHNPAGFIKPGCKNTKKPKNPTPEEDALAGMYKNSKGEVYLPTTQFRAALMYAAKGQKVGRMGLPGIVKGSVFYVEEETLLYDSETRKQFMEFDEIDLRTVVIGNARILRARPKFINWGCIVMFEYDDDFISEDAIISTFIRAGRISGVGDFRPSTTGTFGRFSVELI